MAWVDSIFKFLSLARYNTVPPSPANGDQVELQVDGAGRLITALGGASYDGTRLRVQVDPSTILWFTDAAAAATVVVKASAGKVHAIEITNPGAVDGVAFVFDASARLHVPVTVKAGETVALRWDGGRAFASSLTVFISDNFTATASGTKTIHVSAKYE